jgi:hypothetical protein
MKVNFSYDFTLTFDEPIRNHHFCLRIVPYHNAIQQLFNWKLTLNDKIPYQETQDGFGNHLVYGFIGKPHRALKANMEGEIELLPYVYHDNEPVELYLPHSTLAPFSMVLHDFFRSLKLPMTDFRKAYFLTQTLFEQFKPIESSKAKGLETFLLYKEGLSQDFSHLLIALLRQSQIPARFVNGFIDGINQTHTWVEAFIDGDWRGFDPLNGTLINDEPYIKIAHGRDFSECQIHRGSYIGKRQHILEITGRIGKDEQ